MENNEFVPTPEMRAAAARLSERVHAVAKTDAPKYQLPKKYLSCSQIEMYLRCPRQYRFRYVRDEKRPPGASLVFGLGAHEAVEFTHHHIVDHGAPATTEATLDAFSDSFDKHLERTEGSIDWKAEKTTEGDFKDKGVGLVRLYNEKWAPNVQPKVFADKKDEDGNPLRGIEKRFDVKVGGVPVMGYIDLIDTNDPYLLSDVERDMMHVQGGDIPEDLRTVLCDFKTRAKASSQADADAALQLTLYSYAEQVPAVRFDELLKQKKPKIKRVTAMRQKSDYLWMEMIVQEVAKAISAGVFPPCNPLEWCCSAKWCGFFPQCRGKKV